MSIALEIFSRICKRCNKQYKTTARYGMYCDRCKKSTSGSGLRIDEFKKSPSRSYDLCKCGNKKCINSRVCATCFHGNKNRKVSRILNRERKREKKNKC